MASEQIVTPIYIADDAAFRTLGPIFRDAFIRGGLVQTSDTGQINWTTVAKPSAVSTYAGYEIYRFNDALQPTRPVYIKIEYGTAAVAATTPGFRFTTGHSTDGAGTLISATPTAVAVPSSAISGGDTTGLTTFFCSPSRLGFAWNNGGTSSSRMNTAIIERVRDSSGVELAGHVTTITSMNLVYRQHKWNGTAWAANSSTGGIPCINPSLGWSVAANGDVAVCPVTPIVDAQVGSLTSIVAYHNADIPKGTIFPVTSFGGTRNYCALGIITSGTVGNASSLNTGIAVLWE